MAANKQTVDSPVTGTISEILIAAGDLVAAEQELIIIEVMKMEVPVFAEQGGTVAELLSELGQSVREGQSLLRFE